MNQATLPTMTLPEGKARDYRLPLVILLAAMLAIYFWTSSRYPGLSEKAMMGGDTPLSGLSFDIAIEVVPGASFLSVLWANTINWIVTNIKGMTFGVLFGSMALTLLSLIQRRSFKNGFANSALGAVIGAPLGVCVNCAVPIAMGLHAGRLRLETTLSAMLASPTLNVIVVTMSFALLPVQVAAVKLLAALTMVLVGVPLLCRFILKEETEATRNASAASAVGQKLTGLSGWLMRHLAPREYEAGEYGVVDTLIWFVRHYARNFFFIFIVTVPMMFLAALLGALFVEVFSPNAFVGVLPQSSLLAIFGGMLIVALFLSFAPAPIALDVILTAVLLSIGMSDSYGAAAVVALGSFSVYAFIVIWKAISLRTAVSLWLMVVCAAVCAGILAQFLGGPAREYRLESYRQLMAASEPIAWPAAPDTETAVSLADLRERFDAQAVPVETLDFAQEGERIAGLALLPVTPVAAAEDGTAFTRIVGRDLGIGITEPLHSMARSFFHQFEGGVAAGDIHGDGWTDVVLRKSFLDSGLAIYANVDGEFVRQQADLGPVDDALAHVVALVDLNGDAAPDLFVSTQSAGNYVFWNTDGGFDAAAMVKLPGDDRSITQSAAFADFNRDGVLDIALGNAGLGISSPGFAGHYVESQQNILLFGRGEGAFEAQPFGEYPGQTLSLLASDFDRNGTIDLVAGDDVANTDEFLMFAADGSSTIPTGAGVPFPFRMFTSMSYDEGDINNDLIPDYYGGQIASADRAGTTQERITNLTTICAQVGDDMRWDAAEREACLARLNAITQLKGGYQAGLQSGCERMRDPGLRSQCAARALTQYYFQNRTDAPDTAMHARCLREMAGNPRFEAMCASLLLEMEEKPGWDALEELLGPTYTNRNLLFVGRAAGGFDETAAPQGVHMPGWTWDARFTDLDQDGWQDLLVMSGYWARTPEDDRNSFYRNVEGRFEDAGAAFGLDDPIPSLSAARLDFDRDGDVDLIRSLSGPNVIAHRNDRPAGRGLWVYLRQSGGNSAAIGARVTICTGGVARVSVGSCQVRPIKASGGYQSFDPVAAHFGLGSAGEVSLIVVTWPDGSESLIRPRSLRGGEVVVTRGR
ncbi:FG-GAP-like repeat-containing protein [Erythrobacter sp. EC-HK427]|uniref:FG-GAP-like repeat-containing protein n=1 Tax=Erythrobacter sp. EC-HK427 TaxID=2038396 RepID=UPI0012590683|nr:FG-GAP-like repeat-containing protein [Erythrobacter sp. EC-HK427]VVS97062.1 Repeat domain in Vibrio, Colwellia, Bradyrhizobium and Shewanella [Erythrobacter sp. EC-HK427]